VDKATGILLRKIRFSETSLIVVWMTRELGKLKTSARGALRPGSSFAGKLDLFYEAQIVFTRSRKGEVHTLREISLLHAFDGQGSRYANVATAAYFCDLVDGVTEQGGHAPEIHDLLQRAITYLREQPADAKAIPRFEQRLCEALGIHHPLGDPLQALLAQSHRSASRLRERALAACAASLAQGPPKQ